ncbi:ABC1 kinase family protein [Sphingorhabdus sp.]|uniref:ABC1 kinase family protein n=1 Tax=Sphingorhabdus sp. TaxID=1902408 RepID=UPI003983BFD1
MPPDKFSSKGLRVPSGRLSRIARFGNMATGIAGSMLLDGAKQLASGRRPTVSDLLMTPANALRVTLQLGEMRGAAMKLGQLVSMDTGDFLPPELTDIFARLRADAQHMPPGQLNAVLTRHWGSNWRDQFIRFDDKPIAAASIGQVHRAFTAGSQDVAIKVQYPGVRRSIDSDVDNVATLLRLSSVLPNTLDISSLLAEAKRQLHEEADYAREGEYLKQFGMLLADDLNYLVPTYHPDLSGQNVLVMSYIEGVPIESMVSAPQDERNRIMTLLIELVLRELFEFRLMQTDPNFANYQYDPVSKRVVLLDFGATRVLPEQVVSQYRTLLNMGLAGDKDGVLAAVLDIGFMNAQTVEVNAREIDRLVEAAIDMLQQPGPFDFSRTDFVTEMRDEGMTIAADRRNWHIPPSDPLFVQRKLGGIFLLASRLKAQVDVRSMLDRYI